MTGPIDFARLQSAFAAKRSTAPAAVVEAISSAVLGVNWQDTLRVYSLELARTGDPMAAVRSAAIQATRGRAPARASLDMVEQAAACEGAKAAHILSGRRDRYTTRARRVAMLLMARAGLNQEDVAAALNCDQAQVARGLRAIDEEMERDAMLASRVGRLLERREAAVG